MPMTPAPDPQDARASSSLAGPAPPGPSAHPSRIGTAALIANTVAGVLAVVLSGASAEEPPVAAEQLSIADTLESGPLMDRRRRPIASGGQNSWDRVGDYAVVGGDILIGTVDADGKLPSDLSVRGFGHSRLLDRWPDGIVPFELDEAMSAQQRARVMAAIEHWTDKTRMTFAERGTERADVYPNWVRFIPENGCASFVGRATFPGSKAYTGQPLYAENCTVGSIIHEIGHAVGLYHEHTRPDRDNFIDVALENVVAGREHNFDIVFTNTQTYGAYDYGSIMHYGSRFFSRDGKPTIEAPADQPVGQRVALSGGDIAAVDRMYATDLALEVDSRARTVTRGDGSSGDGLVLDVAVRNIGSLGAHDVELDLFVGENAQWLSVTEDSGWICRSEQARLLCLRDTLAEGDTSRFELHVDPGTHSRDDLVVQLTSRTLDLDASNNELRGTRAKALATREGAPQDAPQDGEPTTGAANPDQAREDDTTTSSGSSGGGGAIGALSLLLAVLAAARLPHDGRGWLVRRAARRTSRRARCGTAV